MSPFSLYFSWKGRIGRLTYWLSSIPPMILLVVLAVIAMRDLEGDRELSTGTALSIIGFCGLAAYCGFAVQVKRWHDRDKSAVWLLMNFVPYIGSLWVLVECGFLRGTEGPNRFDLDPDERRDFERWSREEVAARTVRQNVGKHLEAMPSAYRNASPPMPARSEPAGTPSPRPAVPGPGRVPSFGRRGL